MGRFGMRLSTSPRDSTIADAFEQMARRGKNVSEWVKDTLYAAITGSRVTPLIELEAREQDRAAQEDAEAAQALKALDQRFR